MPSPLSGPNVWFSLIVLGVLLIFWELTRPRYFVPGALGLFLLSFGGYQLAVHGLTKTGAMCCLFAVMVFSIDLLVDTRNVASPAGTAAFTAAALYAVDTPHRGIHPALAIVGAALVGALTSTLTEGARRARTNKRADL